MLKEYERVAIKIDYLNIVLYRGNYEKSKGSGYRGWNKGDSYIW